MRDGLARRFKTVRFLNGVRRVAIRHAWLTHAPSFLQQLQLGTSWRRKKKKGGTVWSGSDSPERWKFQNPAESPAETHNLHDPDREPHNRSDRDPAPLRSARRRGHWFRQSSCFYETFATHGRKLIIDLTSLTLKPYRTVCQDSFTMISRSNVIKKVLLINNSTKNTEPF